jgi:hypothetical protein
VCLKRGPKLGGRKKTATGRGARDRAGWRRTRPECGPPAAAPVAPPSAELLAETAPQTAHSLEQGEEEIRHPGFHRVGEGKSSRGKGSVIHALATDSADGCMRRHRIRTAERPRNCSPLVWVRKPQLARGRGKAALSSRAGVCGRHTCLAVRVASVHVCGDPGRSAGADSSGPHRSCEN